MIYNKLFQTDEKKDKQINVEMKKQIWICNLQKKKFPLKIII